MEEPTTDPRPSNIILANNAKLKSIVNKTKGKNRDVDLVWRAIHKAIDNGEFKIWVAFSFVRNFDYIIKTFEQYGYKCLPDNDELMISWA